MLSPQHKTSGTKLSQNNGYSGVCPDSDMLESFSKALSDHGFVPKQVIPDAKIHRFQAGDKKNLNGWYCLYADGLPAGAFGDWATGQKFKWSAKGQTEMTQQERTAFDARMEAIKIERERQRTEESKTAATKAAAIWAAAEPVTDHPYLTRKNVPSIGLKQGKDGRLIIPAYDADENIQSLQFISPDSEKRFLTDGRMAGGWYFIDDDPERIAIAEGYSTAATVNQATGCTVYVAFNSGNMLAVAKTVKARHPGAQITICCDNDQWVKGNPGLTKGREAAEAIGASVAVPVFKDISTKPTDFNDLAALEGPGEVKLQISGVMEKAQSGKIPPLTPTMTRVAGRLLVEPPPAEYIMLCRGHNFIKKGVVCLLVSLGGLGKTYLMLCMAMLLSRTGRWGCFEVEKPMRTLCLCAEDDTYELDRRLWAIGRGSYPVNLHAASIVGKAGPLMRLDGENPVLSENHAWLKSTIEAHMPLDVLFLDPLSRLYGLNENKNEHATAYISMLETLALDYGLTIMISHHANKASADAPKLSQSMVRGASAFIDGARLSIGLSDVSAMDTGTYGLDYPEQYFKMDILKSNNSSKWNTPVFFRKSSENGLPEYAPLNSDRLQNMVTIFFQAFVDHGKSEKTRDLLRGQPSELFDLIKGNLQKINVSRDMPQIISHLKEQGFLIETTYGKYSKVCSVNQHFVTDNDLTRIFLTD